MKNYIIEMLDNGDLELELVGDANWDYYRHKKTNYYYAIPKKGSGASPSHFGDSTWFKNWRIQYGSR